MAACFKRFCHLRGRSQITDMLFGITAPCAAAISDYLFMDAALVGSIRYARVYSNNPIITPAARSETS